MDKNKLSEADICLKFITPALVASGWDVDAQVFQEFTLKAGRMVVRGQHAARDKASIRRADYMLCRHADRPIAVIEPKDNATPCCANSCQKDSTYPACRKPSSIVVPGN